MRFDRPATLVDALALLASNPGSTPLAGGTDLMVGINFGRERPAGIVSIRHLDELKDLLPANRFRCGAGVTYTRLLAGLGESTPALRQAARTVGSPQIRNAGTVGGNLATCSPAGDTLPVLAALDAEVHVVSAARGVRRLPFAEWMRGPKKSAREADELVLGVEWDDAGPAQAFLKAGTRNAMVISVASVALVADRARRTVRIAIGSSGPVIIRASEAEAFASGLFDEGGWESPFSPGATALARCGELAAAAARPIDDQRGTVAYRRHIIAVMTARALGRAARAA